MTNLNKSIIFPKGDKLSKENFIGNAWLERLVTADTYNCSISNVTFEPGCRNNWHVQPGGQILLVTGGKGYYQELGKSVQIIKEGDVIKIPPGVKHWHGATADSWLVHIAISTNFDQGPAKWMEPITDKEYNNL